jgi:hypothetical protein
MHIKCMRKVYGVWWTCLGSQVEDRPYIGGVGTFFQVVLRDKLGIMHTLTFSHFFAFCSLTRLQLCKWKQYQVSTEVLALH